MNINNDSLPPVNNEIIDAKFITLRESPIEVFGVTIDCDEDSINTMRQALKYFDMQPPLHDVFEIVNGEKCVAWRLTDNSIIHLTKQQLAAILTETEGQKALRTSKLYAKKRQIEYNGRLFDEVHAEWL